METRNNTHQGVLLGSDIYGQSSKGRIFYLSADHLRNASGNGLSANQPIQVVDDYSSNNLGTNITSTGDLDGDGINDFSVSAINAPTGQANGYIHFFLSQQN
ncbi:MAG: hypothetical protein Q8O72_00115 [Bacteroidales bacterium]|nr:hypothetical protein [Bacteroidales bacterium]